MKLKKLMGFLATSLLIISCGSQPVAKEKSSAEKRGDTIAILFDKTKICVSPNSAPGLSQFGKSLENTKGFDSSAQSKRILISGELIARKVQGYDISQQISGLAHISSNVGNTSDLGENCLGSICKEATTYKDIFYSYWLPSSQIKQRKIIQKAISEIFSDWESSCS